MSKETAKWLNTQTLIGFTEKRGNAWHYRAEAQGDESNHYVGPVPVADVHRRLFNWTAEETPLYVPATFSDDGSPLTFAQVADRKAIRHSRTKHVLGIFKDGYHGHDYTEWLVGNVSNILDDDLQVGSAGLLRNGGVAWVSVEVPENIETPEGVVFRPNLVAATSFDGSLATTYKRTATAVVCDNTLAAGLTGMGEVFKAKHTRNSGLKINDAREALSIVHSIADEFAAEVARLTSAKVSDEQWESIVDMIAPMPKADQNKTSRGATIAEGKRDALWDLWTKDERVSPWTGTAFGAYQAYNTYQHHIRGTRGGTVQERNMLDMVTGKTEQNDKHMVDNIMALVG